MGRFGEPLMAEFADVKYALLIEVAVVRVE